MQNSCLITFKKYRSSHQRCSTKKLLKFSKIGRKIPLLEFLFNSEYCKIFKSTYFEKNIDYKEFLILYSINDQVYSNTRVSTRINTNQHESTQFNTNQHESDTNQYESTRVRHESTRVRHESTRVNTSPKQVMTFQKQASEMFFVKRCS